MEITYRTIAPPRHLAPWVRFFWILEGDGPYTHREMANTCPELVFHYRGRFDSLTEGGVPEPSFQSGIQGQSDRIGRFTIDEGFGIFGVYLYPYAVPALFRIPADELTNRMVDFPSILGPEGTELENQMLSASSNRRRVSVISGFLASRLPTGPVRGRADDRPLQASVRHVIRRKGLVSVDELAAWSCLSLRQFERRFRSASGFGPKLFARIARFHAALEQYDRPDVSLTAIAHECGYYDQSHFIRDFKEFSGHLPGRFFGGAVEGTEWRATETSDLSNSPPG